jgi:MtN3 and saliva related transmembrane protein
MFFPASEVARPVAVTVAWLAPAVNCIQLLPQVYKTWTTKRVQDVSLHSLLLLLLTSILWLLHGYFIADVPLMAAGLFTVTVHIVMVTLYGMYV